MKTEPMALATGDSLRLKVALLEKISGGNPELALTAHERMQFHRASLMLPRFQAAASGRSDYVTRRSEAAFVTKHIQ